MSEGKSDISYEEYIPRDKWSIQDWFLLHLTALGNTMRRLEVSYYRGGIDRRELTKLFGGVSAYFRMAEHLFNKFLDKKEFEDLKELLKKEPGDLELEHGRQVVSLVTSFHNKSGLFKIVESKPMGPFAYARAKRGLSSNGEKR